MFWTFLALNGLHLFLYFCDLGKTDFSFLKRELYRKILNKKNKKKKSKLRNSYKFIFVRCSFVLIWSAAATGRSSENYKLFQIEIAATIWFKNDLAMICKESLKNIFPKNLGKPTKIIFSIFRDLPALVYRIIVLPPIPPRLLIFRKFSNPSIPPNFIPTPTPYPHPTLNLKDFSKSQNQKSLIFCME